VTREDPKDAAFKYRRGQTEFAAYRAEFGWVLDEAERIAGSVTGDFPASLKDLFGDEFIPAEHEAAAQRAVGAPSPYVR
jgi:hypothetical protein